MVRSMTAYGRGARRAPTGARAGDGATGGASGGTGAELVWELRSVNHRFLELSLGLPESLRGLEPEARERVRARVRRGKLDATLRTAAAGAPRALDPRALDALVRDLERVRARVPDARAPDALEILRHPGVLARAADLAARDGGSGDDGAEGPGGTDARERDGLGRAALDALDVALDDFLGAREREGAALARALRERGAAVRAIVARVRTGRPAALAAARARLAARLEELVGEAGTGPAGAPDPGLLERELALQATRSDVDEELDRLDHHADELEAALSRPSGEPVGRRLDFLVQEFHREANTIASKAADVATTDAALEIKVLVEQMREQVQNLE